MGCMAILPEEMHPEGWPSSLSTKVSLIDLGGYYLS